MKDSQPDFEQVLTSSLYTMPRGNDDRGWCGYLLGQGESPPGGTISIPDSFDTSGGSYLFALTAPPLSTVEEIDSFTAAVRSYLDKNFGPGGQSFNGRACVWIVDSSGPTFGSADQYAFSFGAGISSVYTQTDLNNHIGEQITLSMLQQTTMTSNDTGLVFRAVTGGVSFTTSPDGRGPSVTNNQGEVPLVGPYSGCFVVEGQINTSVTLQYLGAGVRYWHVNNDGGAALGQTFPLMKVDAPGTSFDYAGAVDPLDATNEQVSQNDIDNGLLRTLLAAVADQQGNDPVVPSWLRTTLAKSVSMVPVGGVDENGWPVAYAGSLVFTPFDPSANGQPIYLSYAGNFALEVDGVPLSGAGAGATQNMLCGVAGVESVSFRAYATDADYDLLRCTPGCAAYAAKFPFVDANINDPTSGATGPRLDTTYLTSWMTMVNGTGGAVSYLALPEGSPLYRALDTGQAAGAPPVLNSCNPPTALPGTAGFGLPMAVYAGVADAETPGDSGFGDIATFESQIISAARKQEMETATIHHIHELKSSRRAGKAMTADPFTAATPQGLVATIAEGANGADYQKVVLANSTPASGRPPQFAFDDLEPELQGFFQSNQLFGVVTNPKYLGKLMGMDPPPDGEAAFENTLTIADWTMTANVGSQQSATDYSNVVIFKFCNDTVENRVKTPNKWIGTDNFSVAANSGDKSIALTGLSQWLQTYIQSAITIADGTSQDASLYKNFKKIVQDKNWQGILVLGSDIDPAGFPDAIKGLVAGIDFSQFKSHHFGVTVSRVAVSGTEVKIDGPSSLFGLVDYELPAFHQNVLAGGNADIPLGLPVTGDYDFTVLQLQVLFKNSTMVDFRSRVQLTTNQVFGSAVTETVSTFGKSPSNAVVLKASFQSQGADNPVYVFENTVPTIFNLDSNVFNALAFNRVQFNTINAGTGPEKTVTSRFLIWGAFNFTEMEVSDNGSTSSFDILSFGTDNDAELPDAGAGLAFSNLQIDMSSPLSSPNAVTYTFDAGRLALDVKSSKTRDGSLFPTFALQAGGFIAAAEGKRPSDFGYLPVGVSPDIEALSGAWFGIVYKVTMGTPGALVADAGFNSDMLLAWSPQGLANGDKYSVFCGLKLPGAAPGAKMFSIQGVLKLSIDSIVLQYSAVTGGGGNAFTLRLNNVGLKILGIAKLPPGGSINFFLFGDPASTGSLGWYAAYNKDNNSKTLRLEGPITAGALESALADSDAEASS